MNIIQFMQEVFPELPYETHIRCLEKATIIVYDGTHLLVGDSQVNYYFGSRNKTLGKEGYKFYKSIKHIMEDKLLYATDKTLETYKNHCEVVERLPNGQLKCIWRG